MANTNTLKSLLREKILLTKDIKHELVHVTVWDVDIEVRGLNGKERAVLLQNSIQKNGTPDLVKLYPMLVISCSYDPITGQRIFEETDRDEINAKSGSALEVIAQVAMKLSGLNEEALKDATKN